MAESSQVVAERWAAGLLARADKMKLGASRVSESPSAKAARNPQAYLSGVTQNLAKWQRNSQRVDVGEWRAAFEAGVDGKLASGVQIAIPKMARFLDQFLPFVEGVAARVRQMPKGTLEQGIARATAQIRGNAGFKRT